MVGKTVLCHVKIIQTDKQFVNIPQEYLTEFTISINEIHVAELKFLEKENKKPLFVSVGGTHGLGNYIQAGSLVGLEDGTPVLLTRPCEEDVGMAAEVDVAPFQLVDWDIVQLKGSVVQEAVLNQVRVVQPNSILSLKIEALKLRFHICKVVPEKEAVFLQPFTQLNIIPPEGAHADHDDNRWVEEMDDSSSSGTVKPVASTGADKGGAWSWLTSILPSYQHDTTDFDRKGMGRGFLAKQVSGIMRIHEDSSLDQVYTCRVAQETFPSLTTSSFFAKLVRIPSSTDKDSSDGQLNSNNAIVIKVKLCKDRDRLKNVIYLSRYLLNWKKLKIGQKVFLDSLSPEDSNDDGRQLEKELWLRCNETESLKKAQVNLSRCIQDEIYAFPNPCPFIVDNTVCEISFRSTYPFAFPSSLCQIKPELIKPNIEIKLEEQPVSQLCDHISTSEILPSIHGKQFDSAAQFATYSLQLDQTVAKLCHLLVTGPSGSGKTILARRIAARLADSLHSVASVYINCVALKAKKSDVVKKRIEDASQDLTERSPGLLVLDNLDTLMFSPSDDKPDDSATTLAVWLRDRLQRFSASHQTRVMVIATAVTEENLHPLLRPQKGCIPFIRKVPLLPIVHEERAAVIKFFLHSSDSSSNNIDITERILSQTEGFTVFDLKQFCEKILSKYSSIDSSVLEAEAEEFTPECRWGTNLKPVVKKQLRDVGGLTMVKQQLTQTLIWPIKYQEIYAQVGVRMPRGVLLYGAPGTGKTLLVNAMAADCGLNYIAVKGPELLSKYIGASEANVRATFARAQAARPCLLFFDEFDSLAPRRGHDSTGVTDRVVNQLLTEMDGVDGGLAAGVWVVAATSRPDLIDPALLRPGRLDKAVQCGIPGLEDRLDILRKLTASMQLSACVDLLAVAELTHGMTGADLKAVLYTAQLNSCTTEEDRDREGGVVTHEQLVLAVEDTTGSVSEAEMEKYNRIYSSFTSGRPLTSKQRATLA